jgi:hypothetical protein
MQLAMGVALLLAQVLTSEDVPTVLEPIPVEEVVAEPEAVVDDVPAAVMARVKCIEAKESGGANVPNTRGSGAGGVMQYMESTFRAHAAELGHPEWSRWEPWQARRVAAHDLMRGRRAQWTVSGC